MLRPVTAFVVLSLTVSAGAGAEEYESDDLPELIEVSGRAQSNVGSALAGSSGTVGKADLSLRPILRVGEVLEVIPGLIATQHSGTGKANQFFLRGFNLDHGTDFATFVDGVPINMRSHGHGQGYSDLNILIPELIERVDFQKGPYTADAGDFASAGRARIKTLDTLDQTVLKAVAGSFGYQRYLAASSFGLGGQVNVLAAAEHERYDGPFEVPEDFEKLNGLLKLSGRNDMIEWGLDISAYDATWRATDQIPLRLVEDGSLDLFGTLDPDLGGNTQRYSARARVAVGQGQLSAYYVDYNFQLFSNFTYFLNETTIIPGPFFGPPGQIAPQSRFSVTPGKGTAFPRPVSANHAPLPITVRRGDEIEQEDRRSVYGADLDYSWMLGGSLDLGLTVGASVRTDDIEDVGLYRTISRFRDRLIRQDSIRSTSVSGFATAYKDLGALRLESGVRIDTLDVSVTSDRPENSGDVRDTIVSPSASLAYRASDTVEIYANYGEGFHSNDARGATIGVDPVSGEPVDPVPLLLKSRGAEAGLRFETDSVKVAVVGFLLDLTSELVYVGDEGTVEPQGASRRLGVEASLSWQLADWANLYTSYAYTRARFRDGPEQFIPNAVPTVFSAELKLRPIENLTSSIILRHVGAAPLIEDNSVRSDSVTTVNWGGFYRWGQFTFAVEVLNVLNTRDADISYFFESRLENEPAPVADIHAHPMAPRQVRATVGLTF